MADGTTTWSSEAARTSAPPATRLLLQAAFVVFTITVVIGILNGIDAVDFGRNTLLTHVHAGTLGWITLGVVGASIWAFRGAGGHDPDEVAEGRLAIGTAGAVGLYVAAFWIGNDLLRPVAGTVMLAVIVWVAAWLWQRRDGVATDIVRLGLLLAIASLLIGAVFGILLGMAVTGRADWVPSQLAEAHPPTMVIGYLIMAALAIVEWRLLAVSGAPSPSARMGRWQVGLVFTAGVVLLFGLVLDSQPLLILSQPLELVGVGLFLTRLRRPLRQVDWRAAAGGRTSGASVVFLLTNIVLLLYVVATYADDPDAIPMTTILAIDHMMFLGAMTNALVGLAIAAAPTRAVARWADDVVFWALNLGLATFVLGLLTDTVALKRTGTPILGVGLLLAIAVHTARLAQRSPAAVPAAP